MKRFNDASRPKTNGDSENCDATRRDSTRRKRDAFFSWLGSGFGSLTLHALVFAVLFWAISAGTRTDGARGSRQTDEIGIVFSDELDDSGGGATAESSESRAENAQNAQTLPEKQDFSEDLQNVAESFLPTESTIGLASRPTSENADLTSILSADDAAASGGSGSGAGGGVGTGRGAGQNVGFGDVRGSGRKFVYVLDRSDSMKWRGGAPMRRAIAETIASVESLDPKRGASKFQLVYYNHEPEVFENGRGLIDVDLANKARVVRFLRSIEPTGGTEPERALDVALKMRPDVVFFLTDADEELSETTLATIAETRRRMKVKQICVVEFGRGTAPKKKSFQRLAGENGGAYVFKDVDAF